MNRVGCKDCFHYLVPETRPGGGAVGFCVSPRLQPHLDGDYQGMTYAGAVRDLTGLCGHAARWFRPRYPDDPPENSGHLAEAQAPQDVLPEQSCGTQATMSVPRRPDVDSECSIRFRVTVTVEPTTGQSRVSVAKVGEAMATAS